MVVNQRARELHESLGKGGWLLTVAFVWVVVWLVMFFWPARYYFDPQKLVVPNTRPHESVVMLFEREINKNFLGRWSVTVRRFTDHGPTVVCSAAGQANYKTDSILPDPLTLDWWTEGACKTLPPGDYMISTTWEIYPVLWPEKQISIDSNIFQVRRVK